MYTLWGKKLTNRLILPHLSHVESERLSWVINMIQRSDAQSHGIQRKYQMISKVHSPILRSNKILNKITSNKSKLTLLKMLPSKVISRAPNKFQIFKQLKRHPNKVLTNHKTEDGLKTNTIVLLKAYNYMVKTGVWLRSILALEHVAKSVVMLKSTILELRKSAKKDPNLPKIFHKILRSIVKKVHYLWPETGQTWSVKSKTIKHPNNIVLLVNLRKTILLIISTAKV